jgi:hypothetical protein
VKAKELLRKLQQFVMLTLGLYPACACIVVFIAPEMLGYLWILSTAFFLLGCLTLLLPKLRLFIGLLGSALFILPPVLLLQDNARTILLIYGIGYSAVLLWSLQICGWSEEQELPAGWLAACMTFLMIGTAFSAYEPHLKPLAPEIRFGMFVFVFLALCSLNRSSLFLAAGGRGSISGKMKRKNLLLIIGMFSLAMVIALVPSIMGILEWLLSLVIRSFDQVKTSFPVETVVETTAPPTTEPTVGGAGGGGTNTLTEYLPPSQTSRTTFVIMTMIAWGVMVPFGIFVLYKLSKVLIAAAQKLGQKIVDGASTLAEDYEDEITDIRDEENRQAPEQEKKKLQPVFVRFTPTEKIRNRYKRLLQKHPQWKQSSTARENLSEEAAQIYEKARYSSHTVTDRDAEDFKTKTK